MKPTLETLRSLGEIAAVDQHFAQTMARLGGDARPEIVLAAALASRQLRAGHVGWDLRPWRDSQCEGEGEPNFDWPETSHWLEELAESPLVELVPSGGEVPLTGRTPLVLDAAGRLYLRRYWEYQQRLAAALRARLADRSAVKETDVGCLEAGLDRLFPNSASEDLQRVAAHTAVNSRFCVLSGGPGTGKTSTVGKILVLLIEQARARGLEPPRIQLAAPTGKAAAHLNFSLERNLAELDVDADVRAAIPRTAATLHRCLGAVSGAGHRFQYGAAHLLPLDVMLVDEASMVDLALMTQLAEAVPTQARLILLGDRDQLASVEAGAVLGDIAHPDQASDAAGAIVHLTHSYRFGADSGVGRLTRAVNAGHVEAALAVLEDPAHPEVCWLEPGAGEFRTALAGWVAEGYASFLAESDPAARLRAFDQFRVLGAHRYGRFGVESLNTMIESQIATEAGLDIRAPFYLGRPLGVTRNDYELELYNGDVGVVSQSPREAGGGGHAVFLSADGRPRSVSTLRLGSAETVFAMSVHKSQGSEFDEVVVVLPEEDSALLTRELIYTAVSRARKRVTLFASRAVLSAAITRRVERASGLAEALWGPQATQ